MTRRILITGATGYIGGRLRTILRAQGRKVRCLVRRPGALAPQTDAETEIAPGDLLDPVTLDAALEGVHTAYYLVHSMGSGGDFEKRDREAACNFAAAARRAGLARIIYLGGLADAGDQLSRHLRSRQEVGELLRSSGVPVIEFRASIIIGAGSLSFEIIRALVERLPVMIAPRWVAVRAQPLAIDDLLSYLLYALDLPGNESRIFEIGGADQVSYGDLMREYARVRGLRRLIIPVPVLTPRLSSLWLGLVTPVQARVGRKLVDSIRNPTLVKDDAALRAFSVRPVGYREAVARALADHSVPAGWYFDRRSVVVPVPPDAAFFPIQRIGGASGWYYANWLWALRGILDRLCGGIGLRRGRRDPQILEVGDVLDFWRVEEYVPGSRLRLAAEMKLPGRAWLEFQVERAGAQSIIRQTAMYHPAGWLGRLYWYAIYPLHALVFRGMLRAVAHRAATFGPDAMRQA